MKKLIMNKSKIPVKVKFSQVYKYKKLITVHKMSLRSKIKVIVLAASSAILFANPSFAAESKTRLGGVNFNLNGGYYVTDHVKLGLGIGYQPKGLNFSEKNGYSYSSLRVMGNIHYYFMPENKVTPFVMAGAGVAKNTLYWQESGSKGKGHVTKASYEIGGGLAFQLSTSLSASIGYKLADVPAVKMKNVANPNQTWRVKKTYQHNISLGLNYIF